MATKEAGEVATTKDGKKEQSSQRVLSALYLNMCQSVVQHCLVMQSEQTLFLQAHGGDVVKTASTLATTTSLVSVIGLLVNQLGGKLSDSLGRKPFFSVGPIVNMLVGLMVFSNPTNRSLLMFCRVMKMTSTSLSGSVMTGAALGETVQGAEAAAAGQKLTSYVGLAIVLAPFLESAILKQTAGSARHVYLGLTASGAAHLISNSLMIPETLKSSKPFDAKAVLGALNPFGAAQIFMGKNADLKKLVSMWLMLMTPEGKNISDFNQLWMRDHLAWTADTMRNWVAWYGVINTVGGLYASPYALKRLSPVNYTFASCAMMTTGMTFGGSAARGIFWWAHTLPLVLGINGATGAAMVPIMRKWAVEEGFGRGEFEAWRANLRALTGALVPIFISWLYAKLKAKGLYVGVIWMFLAWFGNALPALLLRLYIDDKKMVL